ncbi:MAG: Uma2 family endonuclease [Okeania sp. SIO3I5]|uniref:Uma2 family endonuclease n=1 Tax=Okeania sp. SIO3I5 TaxID=2607805 RepID=UPI0013B6B65A|nr:Uma2 family endonuclease [Okeania sp. SIO3I5]NEQ40610.1 Uma2 family endonuclease [Okeania sp. SIO3I5]
MTLETQLSLEQFLTLPEEDITYELIEGKVQPKMSPKRFHSRLTGTLFLLLTNWSKSKGEVGIEWGVILQKNGKDWVPVPDLLYISYDKLPPERFEDELCPFPPELAIEIISSGQSFGDLSEKATDYLNAGVLRVWIIDSKAKSITIFYPDAPPKTKRGKERLTDEVLPELEISVEQIFQQAGFV